MSTNSLTKSQRTQLAAELAAAAPAPDWESVAELSPKKFREEVDLKDGKKRLNFGEMVELSLKLKSEIEYRERIRKDIQTHLAGGLLLADKTEVMYENYPVQYVTRSGSRKLSAEKLMANGVKPDTIAASYEIGEESSFVLIGKPKKER